MHLKKERAFAFIITAASAAAIIIGAGAPLVKSTAAALILAAVVSFFSTPLVYRLAYRIHALDVPRDSRRMHDHPIPRIGGLAIILGFVAGMFIFGPAAKQLRNIFPRMSVITDSAERETLSMLRSILPGAVIIAALGLADDIYTLGPWPKLAVQIIAALATVRGGNVIEAISGIFTARTYPLPGWLGLFLSVLWIVGITNSVNLIDGLDGLACGISAISAIAVALISGTVTGSFAVIPAASLAGACIGFLPYNLNPAWIFMGDTGATFLGYILAVTSIRGLFQYPGKVPFAVPCLILGLPIFDTVFAIVRRVVHGRSPLLPDQGHIYHRLINRGLSRRQTAVLLWMVSAALSILAALIVL